MPMTPAQLVADMRRMADLHPNHFWSFAMAEGADMIERVAAAQVDAAHAVYMRGFAAGLESAKDEAEADLDAAFVRGSEAGYEAGVLSGREG